MEKISRNNDEPNGELMLLLGHLIAFTQYQMNLLNLTKQCYIHRLNDDGELSTNALLQRAA